MAVMQLARSDGGDVVAEPELYAALLALDDADIVELGCGTGVHTRAIASGGRNRRVTAFEVDRVQLERNQADAPANVEFRYGGAEAIDRPAACADVVFMFKSLHHVPLAAMDTALDEVARILRPGGRAWISEPVFAGAFNDIIRRFHDEQAVRQAAFDAVARAVTRGVLELEREIFFRNPVHFTSFADFESRIINATHSEHRLDELTLARVKADFEAHLGADGAHFQAPMRVDLLRRPAAG
ncbi:MAG: class I SAM-dependent methyltransferase [Gammaproteobacteria bacterium]